MKIGIECEDARFPMYFSTSDETCVGKRDGAVGIFLQQGFNLHQVLGKRNRNFVNSFSSQSDHFNRTARMNFLHKETGLRHNGLATTKGRCARRKQALRAIVLRVIGGKEGNNRTGVEQNAWPIQLPKPS